MALADKIQLLLQLKTISLPTLLHFVERVMRMNHAFFCCDVKVCNKIENISSLRKLYLKGHDELRLGNYKLI